MNKKSLYLDCSSGISGDMTVAALLDLGADEAVLRDALASLHLEGYRIQISHVLKSAINACDFDVILDKAHENHDHDMAFLHGDAAAAAAVTEAHAEDHTHDEHDHDEHSHEHSHEHTHADGHTHSHAHSHDEPAHHHGEDHHHHDHPHDHEHSHDHEHAHTHEHDHEHAHEHEHSHEHAHEHEHNHEHTHAQGHSHDHHGRGLPEITEILSSGNLTPRALEIALKIFGIVAEAEAKVHNKPLDEVHFHEVGAVDSIVDIASIAVCLDNLGVEDVIIPVINEGRGTVRCQHGLLPIPVPATTAIAEAHSLPLHITNVVGELVTPTGAAVAAAIRTGEELPAKFRIVRTGIGAGKRDYACAGILRAMLIESDDNGTSRQVSDADTAPHAQTSGEAAASAASSAPQILVMESNIDDCTGEALGFVMNLLLEAGARDAWFQPIYMKKNRPATLLTVICDEADREKMEEIIFCHTTTIGIRYSLKNRTMLDREIKTFDTPWGYCNVKVCSYKEHTWYYPESDSVAKLALENEMSYTELFALLKAFISGISQRFIG